MPSAAYFRRQADICLRLSLIASDDSVASRLLTMARDYMASSEAIERAAASASTAEHHSDSPSVARPDPTPGVGSKIPRIH